MTIVVTLPYKSQYCLSELPRRPARAAARRPAAIPLLSRPPAPPPPALRPAHVAPFAQETMVAVNKRQVLGALAAVLALAAVAGLVGSLVPDPPTPGHLMAPPIRPPAGEAIEMYDSMRIRRTYDWIIYTMEDREVVVDKWKEAAGAFDYAEFMEALVSSSGARYAVLDYPVESRSGSTSKKLIFITWVPDDTPIMQKMLFGSTEDSFQDKLPGLQGKIRVRARRPGGPALQQGPATCRLPNTCALRTAECDGCCVPVPR